MSASSSAIRLRPIRADDLPFLREVYESTREEELQQTGWREEEKRVFLRQQFDAQHQHYQAHYPNASFDVVLYGEEPIGRLYVDRREQDIRIVDIALLPPWRGKGLGSRMIREILTEVGDSERSVSIHVERFNPALTLYERLGFEHVADTGVYFLMEWKS